MKRQLGELEVNVIDRAVVPDHCALRHAGRSRSVQHVSQVFRLMVVNRIGLVFSRQFRGVREIEWTRSG